MDNKQKVGSPDRKEINVNEAYELRYWSEKFGVTHDELKNAVKAAGKSAEAVQKYLKR